MTTVHGCENTRVESHYRPWARDSCGLLEGIKMGVGDIPLGTGMAYIFRAWRVKKIPSRTEHDMTQNENGYSYLLAAKCC